MRLVRVKLQNFRCHKEDTDVEIDNLTAIIGKNDSGKSSILEALQIFFDEKTPDANDASNDGDKGSCCIACEFDELPESIIIDSKYATTLEGEYLLNEHGRLEIHKVFNCNLATPKLVCIHARAFHPTAEGFNDLLSLKINELKKRAIQLGVNTENVDLTVNAEIRKAIWESTTQLQSDLTDLKLDGKADDGLRQIWDQLKKRLPIFQLFKSDRTSTDQDVEAQDPMKSAVKEALRAKQAELAEIAKHVEQEVRAIAEETVKKIEEMAPGLAKELHPQFTTKWDGVFRISLTDDSQVPINKRGSGVRRLILLNFFRAKAEREVAENDGCSVIYAIEEPETSQHPNSQRMLMRALQELSEVHGCQVLLTTHTPTLARLLPIRSLRYIDWPDGGNRTIHQGTDDTAGLVAKALGVLPDNDVRLFIGVEGINDIAFLQRISRILKDAGEAIPNLEECEQDGIVVFIPLGGSSLERWVGRLKGLKRPEFHLFDRDEPADKQPKYHATVAKINAIDNCQAYSTTKLTLENYLHPNAISAARPEVAVEFGNFDNVPELVAKTIHDASDSPTLWDDLEKEIIHSKRNKAKNWLNSLAVEQMTPELLNESDPDGDLRRWLSEIGDLLEAGVFA